MIEFVLDSSAVLADLHGEPGGETVASTYPVACMSAVNYAEILTKLIDEGVPSAQAEDMLEQLRCQVLDADQHRSALVGLLHAHTRRKGISIGDRYCLQLARELRLPVFTTDRQWSELDLGVDVRLIR